ncbi:MAG TPA: cysteine-rich CWC family protein [Telluria sp.]
MSTCSRCGAQFGCAMADGTAGPCWCTELPPVVAVPAEDGAAACWCPACLKAHIAARKAGMQSPDAANKGS